MASLSVLTQGLFCSLGSHRQWEVGSSSGDSLRSSSHPTLSQRFLGAKHKMQRQSKTCTFESARAGVSRPTLANLRSIFTVKSSFHEFALQPSPHPTQKPVPEQGPAFPTSCPAVGTGTARAHRGVQVLPQPPWAAGAKLGSHCRRTRP